MKGQEKYRVVVYSTNCYPNDFYCGRYPAVVPVSEIIRLRRSEKMSRFKNTISQRSFRELQGRMGSVCVGCCTGQSDGSMQLAEQGAQPGQQRPTTFPFSRTQQQAAIYAALVNGLLSTLFFPNRIMSYNRILRGSSNEFDPSRDQRIKEIKIKLQNV